MEKRSVYLDVVKGLAIILVVLTHSIQWGSGEVFFQEKLFFEVVPLTSTKSSSSLFMAFICLYLWVLVVICFWGRYSVINQ